MYLQRYNDHEQLLVSIGEDVLDEVPAGAHQHYRHEQHRALQPADNGI